MGDVIVFGGALLVVLVCSVAYVRMEKRLYQKWADQHFEKCNRLKDREASRG